MPPNPTSTQSGTSTNPAATTNQQGSPQLRKPTTPTPESQAQQERRQQSNAQTNQDLEQELQRTEQLGIISEQLPKIEEQAREIQKQIQNLEEPEKPNKKRSKTPSAGEASSKQTTPPDIPEGGEEADAEQTTQSITSEAASAIAEADTKEEREQAIQEAVSSAAAQKEQTGESLREKFKSLRSLFSEGTTGREETFEQRFQEAGGETALSKVRKLRPQVAKMQQEMEALNAEEARETDEVDQTLGITSETAEARKRKIRREFRREKTFLSANLAAKSAQLNAWSNNLNSARQLASEAAQQFAADRRFKASQLSFLINQEQQFFNSLDQDVQNYMKDLEEFNRREAQRKQRDMQLKQELAISAAENGIDLGWTTKQMQDMGTNEALNDFNNKMAGATTETEETGVISVGGQQKLINMQTGETIKTLGPAETAGTEASENIFSVDTWADMIQGGQATVAGVVEKDPDLAQQVQNELESRRALLNQTVNDSSKLETKLQTARAQQTKIQLSDSEIGMLYSDDRENQGISVEQIKQTVRNNKDIIANSNEVLRKIDTLSGEEQRGIFQGLFGTMSFDVDRTTTPATRGVGSTNVNISGQ